MPHCSLFPRPDDEEARLKVLDEYQIVGTDPEEEFDRLTRLAARLFDCPISVVSLVARNIQFFKSRIGLATSHTGRDVSFCAHAIMSRDLFVVPDATLDPRFRENPLVTGEPGIRFYAAAPLVSPDGQVLGALAVVDVRAREGLSDDERRNLRDLAILVVDRMNLRRAVMAGAIDRNRLEIIADTAPDAILCADATGRILFRNAAADTLFGEAVKAGPVGRLFPDWERIVSGAAPPPPGRRATTGAPARQLGTVETIARRADGAAFPAEISIAQWYEAGAPIHGLIVRDVTERRPSEERHIRLARRDGLTGLANRHALTERLTEVLSGRRDAILFLMDLDGFKNVNDTLGHSAGDGILRQVGARLSRVLPREGLVARLGGDEFAALVENTSSRKLATDIARDIVDTFVDAFVVEGAPVHVGVSMEIPTQVGRRYRDDAGQHSEMKSDAVLI